MKAPGFGIESSSTEGLPVPSYDDFTIQTLISVPDSNKSGTVTGCFNSYLGLRFSLFLNSVSWESYGFWERELILLSCIEDLAPPSVTAM